MNRQIKFRAYSSDMGEWYYGSFIDLYEDDFCYIKSDDCEHFKFADRETVGQYTGLKDKNGKEIYEGDILRLEAHQDFFVDFWESSFVAKSTNSIQRINWLPSALWEIVSMGYEVVGNIYENQELMKN